jgi:hypothetical protein
MLKRRIYKDEIKKGTVNLNIEITGTTAAPLTLADTAGSGQYTVGSAGDEGYLYNGATQVGKVYYNAGVVVFHTGAFLAAATQDIYWSGSTASKMDLNQCAISGNIDSVVYGLSNRINLLQVHNQTNLHSTIYFCRALNNEFNYSSNTSFVDSDGRILPTSGTDNQTRSYITKVGLYDVNDNLLAVASMSAPVKKDPSTELVIRCRLNY